MPQIPDWLRYETRHRLERLQNRLEDLNARERLNGNPRMIVAIAAVSVLVLVIVFLAVRRPAADRGRYPGKTAWFYDMNTGKLFTASSKKLGPIKAPSGPLPEGGPAGFRAHVYSYVLDPNEEELFVGFLQKPDPDAKSDREASAKNPTPDWAVGTLIRRVDANEPCPWVPVAGREGREIIDALTQPNERGQSPIYQIPK